MRFLGLGVGFLVAVAVAAVLGVLAQTQFVLAALSDVGVEIAAGDRLSMSLVDLAGLGPIYAAVSAIGLLVGFLVAAGLNRMVHLPRWVAFALAGFAAIWVMLGLMVLQFGFTPIAGARTLAGTLAMAAAGGFAGIVFARLTPPPAAR